MNLAIQPQFKRNEQKYVHTYDFQKQILTVES